MFWHSEQESAKLKCNKFFGGKNDNFNETFRKSRGY